MRTTFQVWTRKDVLLLLDPNMKKHEKEELASILLKRLNNGEALTEEMLRYESKEKTLDELIVQFKEKGQLKRGKTTENTRKLAYFLALQEYDYCEKKKKWKKKERKK